MHQLILLRHAKASPETAGGSDHDRPLTESGREAAFRIGQAMRNAGLAPDVVLVSSALRTQQTLEALEDAGVWEERPNIDTLLGLYMAGASQITDVLRGLNETVRSALIIGHNPGLQDLANSLAGPASLQTELARLKKGYPTAAMASFTITSLWQRLTPHSAALQSFVQPASLNP
jgi:phosphohistidine phosphatase